MGKITLRIRTPGHERADMQADMVVMRCLTGSMGILPGHQAHTAVLDHGIMRVVNGGEESRLAVFGGVAEVRGDVLTILTSGAERVEDIDRAKAEAEKERIERSARERIDDIEIQHDQVLLRRALMRIEAAEGRYGGEG